ncbi:MAG: DUF1467 family protein [Novosphingobium sp.]|jgi:predicted secreted protein|nr:DUF1467 family protein [Novosphingobium sp.]
MRWTSILAIYSLFWVLSAFLVLPFGVRTHDEAGLDKIAGQADSAPAHFRPGRIALSASVLALVLFAAYYANYVNGWIAPQDLDFFGKPPNYDGTRN